MISLQRIHDSLDLVNASAVSSLPVQTQPYHRWPPAENDFIIRLDDLLRPTQDAFDYWIVDSTCHVEIVLPGSHELPIRSISLTNLAFAACKLVCVGTVTLAVDAGSLGE